MDNLEKEDCKLDLPQLDLPQQLCISSCLSILEEALDQLRVIKTISKIPDIPVTYDTYKTVFERFSEPKIETTEEESRSREERNVLAFRQKFCLIESALRMTFEELMKNGSFEKLLNMIYIHKMLRNDESDLRADVLKKKADIKELDSTVNEEKIFYHKKLEEIVTAIGRLKEKIDDFTEESTTKIKYTREWENAKIEELDTALGKKEKELLDTIRTTEADTFREMRIHQEILNAVSVMQKYIKRQAQINDYKQYKIDQERKRAELEIRNKAATKIQAWWRGTMVRKGFGKFRKKDKKGKKKGPEKKE
ncbi:hypothetical protein NQ318_014347 [Aromia moschata]|uniref:Dynein regulatory complex protein 9 n=1 Tax=Aromia moschata TaxID=1265417 RepID=A0AAV8Z0C3_9CUCU|nr:hypothetical protein NQ318_014347 [Aromia moschata]